MSQFRLRRWGEIKHDQMQFIKDYFQKIKTKKKEETKSFYFYRFLTNICSILGPNRGIEAQASLQVLICI